MKKILLSGAILIMGIASQAQTDNAEALAAKMADRMTDTLELSSVQRDSLYAINMRLHAAKTAVRQKYSGSEMATRIQAIENSRNTAYQGVLTESQYLLYRQKKRNLINNN